MLCSIRDGRTHCYWSHKPTSLGFEAPSRLAPTPPLLPLLPEREVEPLGQRSPTLGPPPSIPGTICLKAVNQGEQREEGKGSMKKEGTEVGSKSQFSREMGD
ncbi:hypothetical protein J1N35_021299 [Gossypium stocksii]|uniref:Uncharacterized protein n=1 Tax=Gossypium stocksii TaxID=47602 RepID=A0A9D3VEG8_9ROSI|nr:hypothetical protein J1N35_021299 [Gossypium stocksii]